jgi:hypothetical protein
LLRGQGQGAGSDSLARVGFWPTAREQSERSGDLRQFPARPAPTLPRYAQASRGEVSSWSAAPISSMRLPRHGIGPLSVRAWPSRYNALCTSYGVKCVVPARKTMASLHRSTSVCPNSFYPIANV